MNDQPLASVAVITYNQEHYIRQTLDSLVNQQTTFPFEIVVGEDASTDHTRAVIEEYIQQYPGLIRLMPVAANKGLLMNFGDTLKACKGKYLSACAGDDYWHNPLKLQKQVDFLEQHPEYGLVHTDSNFYYEHEGITVENYNSKNQDSIIDGSVFDAILSSQFFIIANTALFRKSLFDQYVDFNAFKAEGFPYEDLPTWLELSRQALFKYLPESMTTYRVIENSVSRPSDISKRFAFMHSQKKIKEYFIRKYNVSTEVAEAFRTVYHERKFTQAYTLNHLEEANDSYNYLRTHGKATLKIRLKKTLMGVPVLYRSFNKVKKNTIANINSAKLKKAKA